MKHIGRRDAPRVALVAVATAALLLGGHPQLQFYTLVVAACLAVVTCRSALNGPVRFLGGALVGVTIGIGLAAIQLVPTFELAGEGVRQELSLEEFGSFALPLEQATTLVAPFGFGDALRGYQGAWSFEELSGYTGLLPLCLVAAFAARRSRNSFFWFLTATAIVGVVVALGNATLGPLLHSLPGFGRFRAPARHLLEWNACIAIAAGLAAAQLRASPTAERVVAVRRAHVAVALILATALVANALRAPAPLLWSVALPALLFALHAAVLYWWAADPDRARTLTLIAIVVVDVSSFAYFCEWRRVVPGEATKPPPTIAALREQLADEHQRYTPLLGTRQGNEAGTPNRTRFWQIASTSGFNPLRLRHYAELTGIDLAGVVQPALLRDENRALDLLASRYVVLPNALAPRVATSRRFEEAKALSQGLQDNVVFENKNAMPRAWLVFDAVPLSDEDTLSTIYNSRFPNGRSFDPKNQALVTEPLSTRLGPDDPTATVTIVQTTPTSMTLQTDAKSPSLLITSDAYYPGWRATIDKEHLPIHRAYHTLRAIPIPAGTHSVQLNFHPQSQTLGKATALFALLLTTMLLVFRPPRRAQKTS